MHLRVAFLIYNFAIRVVDLVNFFVIFNFSGIYNVPNVQIGSPSLSPLPDKARNLTHDLTIKIL